MTVEVMSDHVIIWLTAPSLIILVNEVSIGILEEKADWLGKPPTFPVSEYHTVRHILNEYT
jgi:hypothetical protein